ncbi:peptidase domain-containing ABC transporter [Paenibacillus oryzisoli]|uniref:peptidase domain-containing ABC transporter n=1 Tax=Paenibacillus oryzisoli TaxID=1850517 RepID=UPI003D2C8EA3
MTEINAANLHHFPLFDMLTDEELALLSRQLKPASYAMGQTIVDRSEPPDALYIIIEGRARKIGLNQAGKETNLGLLLPGDHFGEHSLFGSETPAAITIRASTPLEVLRLDQDQFKELVERHPDLGAYFRKYIDSDVIRTFLKNNTLFTHVDQAALRSLLNRLEICTYESGACLVREGEPGDAFYILKTGAALVERGAEAAIVNRLYPGDFFGELALLTGEPRKATIRAAEPVTAFRLGRDDFDALVAQFPRILEAIRPIASHYSTQAMTMIHSPEQSEQNVESASVMPPPDQSEPSPRMSLRTWFSWKRRQKYPVLLQQSEMDCGPTCLTMIARYYGLNASVNRMRERCNVGAEGTSMLGLIETLESIGFSAKGLKTTSSVLHELKTPFIAHWNGNHYTVVYEVGKHHLLVANPALGYLDTVPLETFNSHWTGLVITLEPNEPLAALDDTEVLWKRYFAHLNPSRKLLLSTLGLSIVTECLLLVFPVMSQQIFDRVLNTANWSLLHVMLLGMLTLVLFNTGFIFLRQKLIGKLAYAVDHSMLESFYRQLFRLPFSYFFKRTSGDILTRVYENEKIRRMMTEHAIELVLDGLTLLVYGGLMVYYHSMLALVSFALMPIYFALYAVMLPQMRRNFRKQMIAEGESQTQIVEAVNAIATVKGLSLESFIRSKLMAKLSRLFTLRLEGSRLEAVTRASSSGLRSVSNVALLYLGSRYVLAGQLSIGELVAYTVLFTSFQFALELISQRSGELAEARISMERLNDVFESTPEHPQPELMRMLPSIQGHIRFDKVSFRYHRGGSMILQHLDLELKPGQTVALIGRSGSGKSTLANLLLKLLQPSSGEIYVDGYPLRSVHAASIRKQVGVVQQETVLFKGSVRDNIAMNGEETSLEDVQRAAQLAGAHAFIESLPLGYDTMIGEGGLRLSGGQRQRIVIARALVHNPRILIFDEATSALDTESERIIQTNMSEMLQGRTTLIIAHRLSTIRQADLIVVLDQGSIVESGTHEQLVRQQGMYHHLLQQQSIS